METVEAEEAGSALAAFDRAALDRRPFAVAIVDTAISGGSGLELVRNLRGREAAIGLAVIVLTPAAEVKDTEENRGLGVRAYLTQPIAEPQLRDAIAAALASESLERLRAFSSGVPIIQGSIPEIAFDGGLFEDDPAFLAEIVALFLETYPQLLSTIGDAIAREDAAGLRRAAHTLKGSVANFGAKAVVEQAAALETMGKNGSFAFAVEGAAKLRALMVKFEPELRSALKTATKQVVM